jgi:hypothetical protein
MAGRRCLGCDQCGWSANLVERDDKPPTSSGTASGRRHLAIVRRRTRAEGRLSVSDADFHGSAQKINHLVLQLVLMLAS